MGLKITASTPGITRFAPASKCIRTNLTLSALLLLIVSFASGRTLAQGTQQEVTYSSAYANGQNIGYLEYLPTAYASGTNDYPLLISLHGLGWRGRGTNVELGRVKQGNHVAKLIEDGRDFPFIVVSPQQPEDVSGRYTYSDSTLDMNGEPAALVWDTDLIDDVVERVKATRRVDTNRIYLTGTSMGGGGVWQYLKDYGFKIAAAAPVAGRTTLDTLNTNYPVAIACSDNVKNTPIWAFHGSGDAIIEPDYTFEGIQAINNCSPAPEESARFTMYLGATHNVWDRTYTYTGNANDYNLSNSFAGSTPYLPNQSDNDVFAWMLTHSNGTAAANQEPEVSINGDALITLLRPADNITLQATATDSDGTIAGYQWEQVSGPTTASLSGATSATLSVDNLELDETFAAQSRPEGYVFRVTVTDNAGATATDEVGVRLDDPNFGQIVPWDYESALNSNTSIYQPYRYKEIEFRLLFPTDFDSTANDGQKYPLILHISGRGENGTDNDKQLRHIFSTHRNAVLSGEFPGYVLAPQYTTTPVFSSALRQTVEIIQLLIEDNKVDPNRVYVHGLSNGGQAVWDIITDYPKVFAAASPMSWALPSLSEPDDIEEYIHIPIWLSQGGKDNRPTPEQGNGMVRDIREAGGNIRYKYLENAGHSTWSVMYRDDDFFSWLLRQEKTNIHVYYLTTSFCPGESFSVRMGVTAGFDGYEWRKDGQAYAPGLNQNEIVTSATGDYQVRFRRGSEWTEWSDPVTLDNNRQGQSSQPTITAKLQSVNLPALDGSTSVTLFAPAGKVGYVWSKDGTPISGATDSTLTVSEAGAYAVAITEEGPEETTPPREYAPPVAPCQSPFSEPIVVTTANQSGAPPAPDNLAISGIDPTTLQLTWDDQANNEKGFEVYRAESSGGPYELVVILPANSGSNQVSYQNTDLTPNTTYYYRVRAFNNSGGSPYTSEQSVTTGVSDFTLSINFNNADAQSYTAPWNNTARASRLNPRMDNLKDEEGNNTGVDIRFFETENKRWNGTGTNGMPNGLYPNFVRSEYYAVSTNAPVVMTLEGLSPSLSYNFTFYGSANATANQTTSYEVRGTTVTLDAAQNESGVAQILGVAPNANGEVKITVDRVNGSTQAVLNAMIVEAFINDGNTPPPARNLQATALSAEEIRLTWSDESENETGFEVYRAIQSGGPYDLLTTVPSNTESYVDGDRVVGKTVYFYQVKAVNGNGGAFSPQEASVETPNSSPVLDDVAAITIAYGETQEVAVGASDPDGDVVTIQVVGLPPFATFAEGQNGNGMLSLAPQPSDVGTYEVRLTATDAFNGRDEETFFITVVNDAYDALIYVNFENGSPARAPWNNTNANPSTGATYGNLIEAISGTASSVSMSVLSGWNGSETLSASSATVYPKDVVRSYWYTSSQAGLRFSGLDPAKRYNLTILGNSEATTYSSNYTVGGMTKSVDTRFNNNTVQFNGVQPSPSGEVTLDLQSANGRGIINSIILQEYPSGGLLAPTNLTAQAVSGSEVRLTWQDNEGNETNFEVFRSTTGSGPFTSLATVGADSESYSDTGVNEGATYFYQVRATDAGSASEFSAVAFATVYTYSILVNLNGATDPPAPSPWNNTALTPESGLVIDGLNDSDTNPTDVSIRIENWGTGFDNNLGLSTGNNSGVYPDAVLKTFYFMEPFDPAVEFVIENLPADMQYSFTFFGSGDPAVGSLFSDLRTEYSIGQETVILDALGNTSQTVQISDVMPTNGEVTISVRSYEGPTVEQSSDFGIFNALVINAYPRFDGEDPTSPVNLEGIPLSATELRLQWDPSSDNVGVEAYNVYNDGNLVTSTSSTEVVVAIPTSGDYSYTVTAVDAQGNESRPAGPVVPSQNIPLAPTDLTATTQSDTEILLAWQDASDSEQGFEVFRSLNANSDFVRITTTLVNATSFLDENLETNTQYFYQVRAVGTDGNSGFTPVVSSRTFVSNNDPVLNTIANQAVAAGQLLSFDVGATDIDGDPLSYSVENLPSFGILTANNNGTATLSFQPSANDVGAYSVIVTVSDGKGGEDSQVVEITVVSPNGAPTANAGADQTVTDADDNGSEEVTLDGSASADGDGSIASYVWTENGTQIATGVSPTVSLLVGTHTITLTVTDDDGATDTDEVAVTVNSSTPVADQLVLEAECASVVGGLWQLRVDGTASGGQYAVVPNRRSMDSAPTGADARLVFNVEVSQAADYHLFGRVKATSTSSNSFWVRINGGAWIRWWEDIRLGSQFYWNEVVESPFALQLGNNTIEVAYREGDTQLDKLVLNRDGALPVGLGGPEGCSGAPKATIVASATEGIAPLTVNFDGSSSSDPDGSIASYAWNFGAAGATASGAQTSYTFTTPGAYTVSLTVTDSDGQSDIATTTIRVRSDEPVADQLVLEAECASVVGGLWQLRVDGTASGGQYAVVPNRRSMDSAPTGADARLVFNVEVSQAADYHLFGRVKATSLSSNSFWVRINGGAWIRWWEDIRLGSQFYWNEVVESPFALQLGNNTIEVAYREGDTQLDKLLLNRDGVLPVDLGGPEGCSDTPTNQEPLASAGADQTVTDVDNSGSEKVTLDGSASTDSDGSIVSYVWSENGSEIATGVSPMISLPVGTHTITLTVTDNQDATDNDDVLIVVNAPVPNVPVADAGPDQATVDTDNDGDEEITLDGSASTDADGTIASYVWTSNSTQIATGVNPTVTLSTGVTTIVLTVTDNDGNTDIDEVVITIEEAGSVDGYALYVNFSDDGFSPQRFVSPWNNTGRATSQNPRVNDLKDADGASTGINLKLFASTASGDRWNGSSSDGVSGSLYPNEVMNSYYFIDFWSPVTMTLEGLDPALTYDFTFFSGVSAGNRTTEYQIGGQSVTLNATNNTSETVSITGITPSASGTIDVSVSRGASFRGVLNAMIVEGYVDNSVVAVSGSPSNARTAGAEKLSLELLPNPTSYNNVQLMVSNYDPGTTFRIDLVNTAGITVHSQEYSARGATDERVKLDLVNVINGVYFVRVFQGNSIVQKRLILE